MQESANSPRLLTLKSSKLSCPTSSDSVFNTGGSSPDLLVADTPAGEAGPWAPSPSLSTSAADGVTILWLWVAAFCTLPHPIQGIAQECPQSTPQRPAQPSLATDYSLAPCSGSAPTGQGTKTRGPPPTHLVIFSTALPRTFLPT